MNLPTETVCQSCKKPITVEYARLGAALRCPHCLHLTVPQVPEGGKIRLSGYEMTYRDFCQLLEETNYRATIAPLILDWYGFRIDRIGPDTVVISQNGLAIDKLWLHLKLQSDVDRQYKLYETAMSLWR